MSSGNLENTRSPYRPALGGPLLLFLLALFLFVRPLLLLGDGGSCRHFLTGLYIFKHAALPATTYMSAVEPNSPWVTHELLCDLLFGSLFSALGLNWVVLVSAAAISLSLTWAYQMARLRGAGVFAALTALLLALEACTVHWSARPHVFTYLLFLACYYECFQAVRSFRIRLLSLSLIMFLWGNLHGSFPLGILMIVLRAKFDFFEKIYRKTALHALEAVEAEVQAGKAAEERAASQADPLPATAAPESAAQAAQESATAAQELATEAAGAPLWSLKESTAIFFAALAAACLNLRGAGFLNYILTYLTSSKIQAHSDEWRSIDFTFAGPVFSFLILACILLLVWIYSRKRPKPGECLYMLFLFCASLYAMRLIPYFALAALPAMAAQCAEIGGRERLFELPVLGRILSMDKRASTSELSLLGKGWLFSGLALLLSGVFLFVPQFKIADFDPARMPVKAVDYLKENGIKGLGFAKDNWGSYLYWRREEPIFIDDKTDFYSQQVLDDYSSIFMSNPGWEKVLSKYPFSYVLIPRGLPLEFMLERNPEWKRIYADNVAILFAK